MIVEVTVPVLPVCLLEPLWVQFSALLPELPAIAPSHPLGCHRRRVPDRLVFEHVIALGRFFPGRGLRGGP